MHSAWPSDNYNILLNHNLYAIEYKIKIDIIEKHELCNTVLKGPI